MDGKIRDSEQVLRDYFKDDQVTLVCGKHHYAGGIKQKPTEGCRDCAHVMWRCIIARHPGDKREAVEKFLAIVRTIIELEAQGKWDFVAQRPKLTIDKGD